MHPHKVFLQTPNLRSRNVVEGSDEDEFDFNTPYMGFLDKIGYPYLEIE